MRASRQPQSRASSVKGAPFTEMLTLIVRKTENIRAPCLLIAATLLIGCAGGCVPTRKRRTTASFDWEPGR